MRIHKPLINREFIHSKKFVEKWIGCKLHTVNISLQLYSPREVFEALTKDLKVLRWLEFISNHYLPESKDVLLLYPCSAVKPYTSSRSYKMLYNTLSSLGGLREKVHVVTISEPFGLVPEEFYGRKTEWHDWENDWYECPGLFEWWCRRHNQHYDQNDFKKCIDILSDYIAKFLEKTKNLYRVRIAFLRTYTSSLKRSRNHTHFLIIRVASRKASVKVEFYPSKKIVKKIVEEYGKCAWDFYGVAHPYAQQYLKSLLMSKLGVSS
ncbi:MAG: DUF5591 domain-containing protein [Nitrososphaerota archaeon]